MTPFLLIAALLTLATGGLIARSLLRAPAPARASADDLNAAVYREQLAELDAQLAEGTLGAEHHARAREAIRQRLAGELQATRPAARSATAARGTAIGAACLVVAGGALLYAWIGTPAALSPQATAPAASKESAHGLQSEQIVAMVERLAVRLQANPDDVNGWIMLARSYSALGRFDEAARGYGEAARRAPDDAPLLADYADVLAMAQGRSFAGEPDRLIARALEVDPGNIKALALAGTSAFNRKDFARAIQHWSRIRDLVPAESEMARSIDASIAQARSLAGAAVPAKTAGVVPAKAGTQTNPSGAGWVPASAGTTKTVTGTVKLSPALASQVKAGDTLFIYARPAEGGRMPIAIARRPVGQWPVRFELDDSSAMDPAVRLSGQSQVAIEARVSKSGSATPARGDLRGVVSPVKVGASGVVVEIASAVE